MLAFALIGCVVFGLMAAMTDDAKIKRGSWILFVICAAVLVVLLLLGVLGHIDVGVPAFRP
jgi:cell division protein FtsW (lipid II flippase)